MNNSSLEFVWRRLEEPPELFGWPLGFEPRWWVGIALPLLFVALALVVRTCFKESRTIGRRWAAFLGTMRALVYLLLFFVWLLPALRQVETTTQPSKALALFDVSASVQTSDEAPTDEPDQLRPSRQDLLLALLNPPALDAGSPAAGAMPQDLLARLLPRNPLTCYRFGELLDPEPWLATAEARPSRAQWARKLQPRLLPPLDALSDPELSAELAKAGRLLRPEQGLDDPRARELAENLERTLAGKRQLTERLLVRTNLGAALRDALRKEANGNLQGVILFSDGRANAGSDQELNDAVALAKKERIPIFTVGLGRFQRAANLRLVDLLAPSRIQPEDEFPVRVAVEGERLPVAHEAMVTLKVDKPNGTTQELTAPAQLAAAPDGFSRGAAEFRLANPEKLKGDWKLTARLAPLKGERTRADNVLSEPTTVKVEERKLSVLLISSGPLRDYLFLRTLLTREQDKFDVAVWLQSAQPGTVQDIDPKRLLDRFPTELRDRDADPMNLGNYDVIVAFDPDWRLVPWQGSGDKPSPQANLKTWVEQLGGGLCVVAGPVHAFSLARDPTLQAIRTLYPVLLDDTAGSILQIDRQAKDPFALNWDPAATSAPFLDLLDAGDASRFFDGWELFFETVRNPANGLAEGPAERGFFTFFPLQDVKPGAQVLARFGDPDPKVMTPGGQRQPYFVLSKVGKGPVFFIGSPEIYRLRDFSEKFHERFWTKLLRQLGKRDAARGLLVVGSRYAEGETVVAEVELLDANLKPLSRADFVADMRLEVRSADAKANDPPLVVYDEGLMTLLRGHLAKSAPELLKAELSPQDYASAFGALRAAPSFKTEPAIIGAPGKFVFRFPAKRAGLWRLDLQAPGSSEKLTGRFTVEAADPERDDARPNLALLHRLATPAREVQLLEAAKKPAFLAALARARQAMEALSDETGSKRLPTLPANAHAEEERLYFDLQSAPWIAECLDANPISYRTEGKTTDLWDKGLGVFRHLDDPDSAGGPSWALCLAVALLGAEWLTRKLLRLA